MTIGELKEIINSIPDDFTFEIEVEKEVSQEELSKRKYPYPFDSERCQVEKDSYDIGWSDAKMKIIVTITKI